MTPDQIGWVFGHERDAEDRPKIAKPAPPAAARGGFAGFQTLCRVNGVTDPETVAALWAARDTPPT